MHTRYLKLDGSHLLLLALAAACYA